MLSDYRFKNAVLSKKDVESQQRHYYDCKEIWEHALEQLKEGLDEEQALKLGYEV